MGCPLAEGLPDACRPLARALLSADWRLLRQQGQPGPKWKHAEIWGAGRRIRSDKEAAPAYHPHIVSKSKLDHRNKAGRHSV